MLQSHWGKEHETFTFKQGRLKKQVFRYLDSRKKQLGLIWGIVTKNLVETFSKN